MNEFAARIQDQTAAMSSSEPLQNAADQVLAASREMQDAAADFASSSAAALKGHASELMDAAKDVASHAGDRLQEKVAEQKGHGADYVNNLADTIRRAAREFDPDLPFAGSYMRKAAAQVENAADALRNGNFNDLVEGAQSFARKQPAAFLGLAVLAGFGAVRFLKSSSPISGSSEQLRSREDYSGAGAPNSDY
jgi:ElaB/YqjD/DUF883 family membrane-anchored ribosome-binding protein